MICVQCNKQLAALQRLAKSLRRSEARVLGNIVTSLASRLQEVAGRLRTSQGRYLRRLEDREQRSSQYFTHIQPDTETEVGCRVYRSLGCDYFYF